MHQVDVSLILEKLILVGVSRCRKIKKKATIITVKFDQTAYYCEKKVAIEW